MAGTNHGMQTFLLRVLVSIVYFNVHHLTITAVPLRICTMKFRLTLLSLLLSLVVLAFAQEPVVGISS